MRELTPQQSYLEEEQSPPIYTGQQPYIDETKFNFMRWQLDTDELLTEFENIFRSKVKTKDEDGNTKWVERTDGKPLLNELGISRVMSVLQIRFNRINMMSDLEDVTIRLFAACCADSINDLLYQEGDTFGMNDSDWQIILDIIYDEIFIVLRRSYKGGERRFISLVERAVEQILTRQDAGAKPSVIPNPMNFFKRK